MTTRQVNSSHVFRTNLFTTLVKPFDLFQIYLVGMLIALLHIGLLPISLGLGATVKSIVDILSRRPLTTEQIEEVKSVIQGMNSPQFDAFVQRLAVYHGKSNSSFGLSQKIKLFLAGTKIEEKVTGKREELIKALRQSKVNEAANLVNSAILGAGLSNAVAVQFQVYPRHDYKLSAEEMADVETQVAAARYAYVVEMRAELKAEVIAYLDNSINAGKKMEHVIHEQATLATPSA